MSETPERRRFFQANFQTNLIAGLLTVTPLIVVWLVFDFFLETLSQWGHPLAVELTGFLDDRFPVLKPWLDNEGVRWVIGVVVALLALYSPKGYAGELEFEAASFLHNPTREYCEAGHLERRVHRVATRLGLSSERLLRWCFAHGVLSALWSVEDDIFDPVGGIEASQAALQVLGHAAGT